MSMVRIHSPAAACLGLPARQLTAAKPALLANVRANQALEVASGAADRQVAARNRSRDGPAGCPLA